MIKRIAAAMLVAGGLATAWYVASTSQSAPDVRQGPDVRISMHMNNGQSGICSGAYLGNRIILTAKHCVSDETVSVDVIFDNGGIDGVSVSAKPFWKADKADIAAYKLDSDVDAKSAELSCRDPKIGEDIEVVGNPLGINFVHTWGKVAGVSRTSSDGEEYVVPVDAGIASGNSGGPIYDLLGKVLGIADAVIQGQFPFGPGVGHVDLMVSSQAACGEFGPK